MSTRARYGWGAVLQRGIDTAAEFADGLSQRLGAVADPRAKLQRKRRWALRLGLFFALSSCLWIGITVLLAVWSTPAWVLLITGIVAAGAAFPATLALLRYRWLRTVPLPPERSVKRLPPWGSAARPAMATLASSERGMFELLGVVERGRMLPIDELGDIRRAATRAAVGLAATATEVVSLERAAAASTRARAHLTPTIGAMLSQLDAGVRQYGEIVTAAARLVSAANAGAQSAAPMAAQRHRNELVSAADRLTGWAKAFDELGQLRRA